MNRPDPVMFTRWSYYLALTTSGLLLLTIALSFVPLEAIRTLPRLTVALALITSAVGTFMAWAARKDFATNPGPDDVMSMLNVAWRLNRLSLILIAILAVLALVFALVQNFMASQTL